MEARDPEGGTRPMDEAIVKAIKGSPLPFEELSYMYGKARGALDCLDLRDHLTIEVSPLFDDHDDIRTAFYIKFEKYGRRPFMALEVSKMGPFAKIYWMLVEKKFIFTKRTSVKIPPDDFWGNVASKLKDKLNEASIRVLTPGELYEDTGMTLDSPIGPLASVDGFLFYFDGPMT